MDGSGTSPGLVGATGIGSSLALSLISLGVVCVIAYLSLRFLRFWGTRGIGRGAGPIRVLGRCALEPRRSVYLIETAGRCFLVGVGDGPMSLLAEIGAAELARTAEVVVGAAARPASRRFSEVLARVLGAGGGGGARLGRPASVPAATAAATGVGTAVPTAVPSTGAGPAASVAAGAIDEGGAS